MDDASTWLCGAVGYQAYVRSFFDTTGDGAGDLRGIRQKLPYIASLGVDVVWLTPFYPSPLADHGYDVADYLGVDTRLGTVEDVAGIIEEAHGLGLRLLVDLVPNHTSSEHRWFEQALANADGPYRNYYIWVEGDPDAPPNNWVAHFGGPAWTHDSASGAWYLHLFLPEQPDLNWRNPTVASEFDAILHYWLDVGVDGFRIDVAHGLLKDPQLRDNPQVRMFDDTTPPGQVMNSFEHVYDLDQEDTPSIYRRFRPIADGHGAALLGETYVLEPAKLAKYVEDDALHGAFYFPALWTSWDAEAMRDMLMAGLGAAGGRIVWPVSSHDDDRAATRFGGGQLGARRQLAWLTLLSAMPGTIFILAGDELGLENGKLDAFEDPIAVRNPGATGRDGSRTPMPWRPGVANFGFTTGTPWLGLGTNRTDQDTVEAQEQRDNSHLQQFRRLMAARRQLTDLRSAEPLVWLTADAALIAIRRGQVICACNFSGLSTSLTIPGSGRLSYTTDESARVDGGEVTVPGNAAVLVRLS